MKIALTKPTKAWMWISYLSKAWNGHLVTFVFSSKGIAAPLNIPTPTPASYEFEVYTGTVSNSSHTVVPECSRRNPKMSSNITTWLQSASTLISDWIQRHPKMDSEWFQVIRPIQRDLDQYNMIWTCFQNDCTGAALGAIRFCVASRSLRGSCAVIFPRHVPADVIIGDCTVLSIPMLSEWELLLSWCEGVSMLYSQLRFLANCQSQIRPFSSFHRPVVM